MRWVASGTVASALPGVIASTRTVNPGTASGMGDAPSVVAGTTRKSPAWGLACPSSSVRVAIGTAANPGGRTNTSPFPCTV